MLDFRLLSASQLILFLLSFALTFVVVSRWRPKRFRVYPGQGRRVTIYFAGLIPATIITLLSFFVIESLALKLSLLITALGIILVGRADEKKALSPATQLGCHIGIALLLALFGWAIPYVSNPVAGGILYLGAVSLPLTVLWIVLVINAVNWFDGLDGLASSVAVIAFLTLAAISLLPATQDATTLSLSLIGAGALLGFLLLNAPPARVYLGTIGSWFLGSYLAITAIVGGGKVATAALVLAIPLLDVIFVIVQRLLNKQHPWVGDTKHHLYHRLAAAGFSPRQIVIIISAITVVLGIAAVILQTQQKLWLLASLVAALAAAIIVLAYVSRHRTLARR